MFYGPKEHLKAQLEERFRTALDFATLGTYEREAARHPVPPGPEVRVSLFAKVSAPCPHSPAASRTCDAAGVETAQRHGASAGGGPRRRARRGGMADSPPQPCTWAAAPDS
jgi:hypothetical protein